VITIDGVIEAPTPEPDGWFIAEGDHEPAQFQQFVDADAMLIGRKSYEGFAAGWPTMAGDGRWADRLNEMPKYVASRTLSSLLTWNATLIEGDAVEAVRSLKRELSGDLMTSGCGSFARHLAMHELIDEMWFWVHPTVWGEGERAFHDGPPIKLDLIGSETFDSGVTLLRYAPPPS
jgi:dihydrofolate reductase